MGLDPGGVSVSDGTGVVDTNGEWGAAGREDAARDAEATRTTTEPDNTTHEALFEALSNQRRRFALHYLKQREEDDPVELADLSAQITAWERGIDPGELSYADRKNVHTSLSQFHAPKLDDLGFARFDREAGTVELTDRAEDVEIYFEAVSGGELAWGPYLLFLSSALSALVFASLIDAPMLAGLSHDALAVFVAVAFFTSSAFFTYDAWTRMRVGVDGPPPEATDR